MTVAKSAGFWSGSEDTENDVVGIDFAPNAGSATIVGTPTITGVNCTAALVAVEGLVVTARYTDGEYAGKVLMSVVLSDGRTVNREVELRFV